MAKKNPISRITSLSARIEQQLNQFSGDDEGDTGATEGVSRPEKKKRHPLAGPGMAATAVTGGMIAATNRGKIKEGFQKAKSGAQATAANAKEAGRTAAFRGMRKTADVMQRGSKVAGKVATQTSWKHQGVRKGAASVSETLAKGAKKLKKGSMKFFTAETAAQIVRLEAKFRKAWV